jgi:hypothetical protein
VLPVHPDDNPPKAFNLRILFEMEGVFVAKVELAITGSALEGLRIYYELGCVLFDLPKIESPHGVRQRHTLGVELLAEQLEVVLVTLGEEGEDHAEAVLALQEPGCRGRGR